MVRNGAVFFTTVTGLSFTDTGLTPNTAYTWTVRAVDAAGNVSPDSPTATATTLSGDPAVLFQDSWDGADGSPWGASWTVSNTNGSVTTQAGGGRLLFNDVANAYARAQLSGLADRSDSELLMSYRWTASSPTAFLSVYVRGSGDWQNGYRPRNGYGVQLQSNSTTAVVQKNVNGTVTTIRTIADAQDVTTGKQWLRLRVVGSQIQLKAWAEGESEPAAWTSSDTDTSVTASGQLFLSLARGGSNSGVKSVRIDDLVIREASP